MIVRNRSALCVATISALLTVDSVNAERWYVEPKASLYSFWEDNVRLTPDDEIDSTGVILRGDVEAGRKTEISEISINSAAVAREYFDEGALSTVDYFFDGLGAFRLERDEYQLNAQFILDSTLTSEEQTTGLVQRSQRRTRWGLAPRWTRQLTERLSGYVEGSYADVSYDDTDRLTDFSLATVGTGTTYELTERTAILGQLSYEKYDADESDDDSDTFNLLGGVSHAFSETLEATALAGVRSSETEDNESSTGGIFDVRLVKRFEVGSLSARGFQELLASGGGDLVETLGFEIGWDQQISSRWRWSLDANAYFNSSASGETDNQDRDYYSITPQMAYLLDEEWSISGGYRYRYQDRETEDGSADANAVFFTLSYVPLIER